MKSRFAGLFIVWTIGLATFAWTQNSTNVQTSKQGNASASASASSSSSGRQGANSNGSGGQSGFVRSTLPPTHAILYTPGPNWIEGKSSKEQQLQDHGAYMASLVQKGILIFAGPWRDEPGLMAVIRVKNDADARTVLENDPGIKQGVLQGELRAWDVVFQGTGYPTVRNDGR